MSKLVWLRKEKYAQIFKIGDKKFEIYYRANDSLRNIYLRMWTDQNGWKQIHFIRYHDKSEIEKIQNELLDLAFQFTD